MIGVATAERRFASRMTAPRAPEELSAWLSIRARPAGLEYQRAEVVLPSIHRLPTGKWLATLPY